MRNKIIYVMLVFVVNMCVLSGCSGDDSQSTPEAPVASEEVKPTYDVPDVTGLTESKAKKTLDKSGIEYVVEDGRYSNSCKKGEILEQSAVGQTTEVPIVLKRCMGREYRIEDLEGKQYSKVKKKLKPFKKYFNYTYSTKYKAGEIIFSDFSSKYLYHDGDAGNITISLGKYNKKAIKNNYFSNIKSQFPGAKFKVKYKLSTAGRDKVLSYKVGKASKKNKVPVSLVLSNGLGINVPNLIDEVEYEACRKLDDKGIKYTIKYIYKNMEMDPTCCAGNVTFQSKKGKINRNRTVKLTINKPAITISQMGITKNYADGVCTNIEFCNETDKTIASVVFDVAYLDRVGDKASDCDYSLKYVGPLYGYDYVEEKWGPAFYNEATAALKPIKAKIKFMDGSTQNLDFTGRYWYMSDYAGF